MNFALSLGLLASVALAPASVPAPGTAPAPDAVQDAVQMVVVRVGGTGSTATAHEVLDAMIGQLGKANAWPAVSFEYFTDAGKAKTWVEGNAPRFGILSFGAYLAWHETFKVTAIGSAVSAASGGGRYYIVSKTESDLEGCKGKTLASNHADDTRFVDKVISAGVFAISDFTLVKSRRPVQTLKMVIRDEAACALIDQPQLEAISTVDGGGELKTIWLSQELPSMVVVAFSAVDKAEREKVAGTLPKVCEGEGKKACEKTGVSTLAAIEPTAYAAFETAYAK